MNFLQTVVFSSHIFSANTIDIAFPKKKREKQICFYVYTYCQFEWGDIPDKYCS